MDFRLSIHTGTDAFTRGERDAEVARILQDIARRLEAGEDFSRYRTLLDINGNDDGRAAFKT